jgi:hypothetical protein
MKCVNINLKRQCWVLSILQNKELSFQSQWKNVRSLVKSCVQVHAVLTMSETLTRVEMKGMLEITWCWKPSMHHFTVQMKNMRAGQVKVLSWLRHQLWPTLFPKLKRSGISGFECFWERSVGITLPAYWTFLKIKTGPRSVEDVLLPQYKEESLLRWGG